MALATTCPQCKTSFKVVPDQLKLRRGLVRCGVCQHVFSGVEHLRYVDRDEDASQPDALATPTITAQPSTPAVAVPANSTPQSSADASPSHAAPAADDDPATDTLTPSPDTATDTDTADRPSAEEPAADDQDTPDDTGARRPSNDKGRRRGRNRTRDNRTGRSGNEAPRAAPAPRPAVTREEDDLKTVFFLSDNEEPLPGQSADDNIQLPASLRSGNTAPQPNDLDPDTQAAGALIDEANRIWRQHKPRHADGDDDKGSSRHGADYSGASDSSRTGSRTGHSRRSRRHGTDGAHGNQHSIVGWLTPARRRHLVIGLSVLAAVQLVSVYRTEIAYHLPFLRPVASAASLITGQDIKPPMSLGALSIESFELRNTQQPGKTRMTAILRNRSKLPTRWPAMELTLTGPSNAVVVRKVLLPSQYLENPRAQAGGMPPNSEHPIDLLLETSDLNLAGYSVALFYP